MAQNTKVTADTHAPPVTRILAEFVAAPSVARLGRSAGERGASHLPQLGRLRDRRLAARRRSRPRSRQCRSSRRAAQAIDPRTKRARRHGQRGAAQRHHLAHVRLRRHAPEDDHPSRGSRRVGGARAGRAPRRERPAVHRRAGARHRCRVPRRQRDLPGPLRSRLAHHRIDRHARRGCGVRAAAGARRAAHGDGAGHRRVAADRRARAVRHR